jgi:UDP-N-acetylmuramate dehydrogenase
VSFAAALASTFGPGRARSGVPLAPFTTFRVGGPADWFLETFSADEFLAALRLACAAGVPVTVLGGGSNVLIADAGIRGLVLRPRGGSIEDLGEGVVRADAPIPLTGLVRWTINRGYAGLERWAGTPGTIGGAVFGNAHYGGQGIGRLLRSVRLATAEGSTGEVAQTDMELAYDSSRLVRTGELLLSATFLLRAGADSGMLRTAARESIARRKSTQPLGAPSAGCVFQNPDPARDRVPSGVPPSAGALVDRAGLKGARVGSARVSSIHANFIVNDGGATASDVRALMTLCRRTVAERFGVELREEIRCLGEF